MGSAAVLVRVFVGHRGMRPSDAAYMHVYWRQGFMPMPPKTVDDVLWVFYQFKRVFRWTGPYRASALWIGLMTVGAFSSYRRLGSMAWLVVGPVLFVI